MQIVQVVRRTGAILAALALMAGCSSTPVDDGKVPITTKSEKAREQFVQARDFSERLRGVEALALLKRAVEQDSQFAQGYLLLAQVSPGAGEFFANLDKARKAAAYATEAEQLMIQAFAAQVNGDLPAQEQALTQLATLRPNDERVQMLLGNYYFGLQRWPEAITHYQQAVAIDSNFSPVYNQLGYSYRFNERMAEAEAAFKKYIALIPDDPNPYDSYAELLMKLGRFEESIAQYERALKVQSTFPPSYFGIASNLNFLGRHAEAREKLQQFFDQAENDGQRRAAYAGMAISAVDEGNYELALQMLQKMYDVAAAKNDFAAMSGDVNLMGNVFLEMGRADDALKRFQETVDLQAKAQNNSEQLIALVHLNSLYDAGRVALAKGDLATAKDNLAKYQTQAEANKNRFQIWLGQQLAALIALQEQKWDAALAALEKSNLQNPYNLCLLAEAYRGLGDTAMAQEFFRKAADYNLVNNLNQSLARRRVATKAGGV